MNRSRVLFGLALSLGLLWLLFQETTLGGLISALRRANYVLLVCRR